MFYFDDNAMTNMLSLVTKNIGEMHGMEDGYLENMSPISKSGVYGNGIQMIDSQIVSIKDSLTDFRNITANNSNAMIELEKRLSNEVEKIVLPTDFDAGDIGLSISTNQVSLDKIDGNAINTNSESFNSVFTDSYDVENKEITEMKNTDDDIEILEFDFDEVDEKDIQKLKEEELQNISLDDYYDINKNELLKLKYSYGEELSLDDYMETAFVPLDEVKKENVEESKFEDDFDINEVKLKSMGDNNGYKG